MEMASAHGLALKLAEMDRLERMNRNNICEIISEEDKIIKSWFAASNQSKFHKVEFFSLTRRTLLFVLSQPTLDEVKKKELLRGVSVYFNKFSNLLKHHLDIRKPLIEVIVDPWKNKFFSWEELFQKRIGIRDTRVQQYFSAEPEEIVLARVHWFSKQGKDDFSMVLAKSSFLFHSRINKSLTLENKNTNSAKTYKRGTASIDWYVHNLRRKKSLTAVFNELKQLSCHEGVLLVMRLRQTKLISFAFATVQIFLMQDLIRPSEYCCTKKLFSLWCILHKEQKSSVEVISEEIRKILALHAPSSAHFYLFVDALWEQFGPKFINLYVELYIRGLTVDLNYLEAARNDDVHEDVIELESHIASTFEKLHGLFSDFHDGAARECMFSAFSLKPTKNRLLHLQSLTLSILSIENEMKSKSLIGRNAIPVQECKCAVKCTGFCKSVKEYYYLDHPILMKGIQNIPYAVVKDLVSVLESVRCICFQYNVFNWHDNATDLGDYLRDFTESKSWESDTEYASEGSANNEEISPVKGPVTEPTKMEIDSPQPSAKRKNESDSVKEIFALDIGADIEVRNEDTIHKKIKTEDSNQNVVSSTRDIFAPLNFPAIGMEDAIENVIRMTLDNKRQKSNFSCNPYSRTTPSHMNDVPEKLSLLPTSKPISDTNVSPYSTNYRRKSNTISNLIETDYASFKSNIENTIKQAYFSQTPPTSSHLPTSSANYIAPSVTERSSMISPTILQQRLQSSIHEKSQVTQNKFLTKPSDVPCFSKSSGIQRPPVSSVPLHISSEKNTTPYQQEALDLNCKNSVYEQIRKSLNHQLTTNQTAMQAVQKSSTPVSSYPKTHLSNIAKASPTPVSAPVNLIQLKQSMPMQSSHYLSASHHAPKVSLGSKTDSSYQVLDNSSANSAISERMNQNMTYIQDNQLVHSDRSSVIQHTMQHVRETTMQNQLNEMEVPNQLSVSVNSNAVEQIRNVPKRVANLPPFKVNVADKSISNSLAVSANLVIARKPHSPNEVSCQQTSNSATNVKTVDTITIPGILASPSVIVSPWEAQRKVHGEMLYKKNTGMNNPNTIDRRIYKHRLPYEKKHPNMLEPNVFTQRSINENNSIPVSKTYVPKSHIKTSYSAIPPVNQILKTSHNQAVVDKSLSSSAVSLHPSSSQAAPPVTSSQPWYSEPYPKPSNRNNDISTSSSITNTQKNVQPHKQVLQPVKLISDAKSFTVYTAQRHIGRNQAIVIPTVTSTLTNRVNIPVSSAAVSSGVQNTSSLSIPATYTTAGNSTVVTPVNYNSPAASNNRVQIRTYATVQKPMKINSTEQSGQLQLVTNQISVGNQAVHTVPDVRQQVLQAVPDVRQQVLHAVPDVRIQVAHAGPAIGNPSPQCSQASSEMYPKACCSPSEVNPCQSCSLPSGNNLTPLNTNKSEDPSMLSLPSSKETVPDSGLIAAISHDSNILDNENDSRHQMPEPVVSNCQFCLQPFLETDLQTHILNCPSHEFNMKGNLIYEMDSSFLTLENPCNKSLPDVVPEQEQESLYQKESFNSNIPQTKTFVSAVDDKNYDKNLDEIDANAFNVCMDLINNDNDLKRIVQGIDSFDQMENNFLSYLPPPNTANFVSSNSMQKDMMEVPLQNNIVSRDNDLNNYAPNCEPPLQVNEIGQGKYGSVFDFSEKETDSSRADENFNIADMIKASLQENGSNELESVETILKDNQKDFIYANEHTEKTIISKKLKRAKDPAIISKKFKRAKDPRAACPYCLKKLSSLGNLKRHIKLLHPNHSSPVKALPNVDVTSPADKSVCDVQVKTEVNSTSGNSLHDSSGSLNYIANSDVKHDNAIPSTSEVECSPKSKNKSSPRSATTKCKFCGKILTLLYMKTHINKKHKDLVINSDNTSCPSNDTCVNIDGNKNPLTPAIDSIAIPVVPPVLEQDIDSSTCLSVSDALKRNSSYTVAEDSPHIGSKIDEKNNVKFDFNELELSKRIKTEPEIMASKERSSTELNSPPLVNVSKFDDNKVSNTSNNQQVKCLDQRQSCIVCGKSYNSTTSLNRHLRTVHNVLTVKPQKKNMNKSKIIQGVKTEDNQNVLQTNFHSNSKAHVGILQTSVQTSKEMPEATASSNTATMVDRTKEKYRNPVTPNINRNLLRAVLQSNFVKDQAKSHERSDVSSQDIENLCDKSKILGMDSNCNIMLNAASGSSTIPELKSLEDNIIPPKTEFDHGSVPSEILASTVKDNLYSVIPGLEVNTPLDPNLQDANLHFDMPVPNLIPDIKYSNVTDSENSSYQSNEISPVSEIISNVSRCNFVGTSNTGRNAEIFEDNSLKLPIPENKEVSSSNISNDHNIAGENYKMDNDQENLFKDFEKRSLQDHLSPELDKGCIDENNADFECKVESLEISNVKCDAVDNCQDNFHMNQNMTVEDNLNSKQNLVNNDQINSFGQQVNSHQGNSDFVNENKNNDLHISQNAEIYHQSCYDEVILNTDQDHSSDKKSKESIKQEGLRDKEKYQGNSDQMDMTNADQENKINHDNVYINDREVVIEVDNVIKDQDNMCGEKMVFQNYLIDDEVVMKEDKVVKGLESICDENSKIKDNLNDEVVMEKGKAIEHLEILCDENMVIKDHVYNKKITKENESIKDQDSMYENNKIEDDFTNGEGVMEKYKVIKVQESMSAENKIQDELNYVVSEKDKEIKDKESLCGENVKIEDDLSIKEIVMEMGDMSNDNIKVADDQEASDVQNKMLKDEDDLICAPIFVHNQDSSLSDQGLKNDKHISLNFSNKEKGVKNESCELRNLPQSSKDVMCRLCLQNLDSMEILSKHLKEAHNIPVLKKQISEPSSPEKLVDSDEIGKLSPPKLKPGASESDSESASNCENVYGCPKLIQNSPDLDISKNMIYSEKKTLFVPPPFLLKENEQKDEIAANKSSSVFEKSRQEERSLRDLDKNNSPVVETLDSLLRENQDGLIIHNSSAIKNVLDQEGISVKDMKVSPSNSSIVEISNSLLRENHQKHNSPSKLKKIFEKEEMLVKDVEISLSDSSVVEASNCSLPEIKYPSKSLSLKMNEYNIKNLSLSVNCSTEKYSPPDCDSKHSSLAFGHSSGKKLKRKSTSLPNLSVISDYVETSNLQHKIETMKPVEVKNIEIINSGLSDENSSLDSMFNNNTNSSENTSGMFNNNTNSSENTSESLSSLNNSVQEDEISINSSFILPTSVSTSVPQKRHTKTVLTSKFCGRKLIIQRLKTYQRFKRRYKKRSALFTRHKVHSKPKNTCNPIILTLEKAADVQDFLKTHKQPVIKLVRLKDNDLACPQNEKSESVSKAAPVKIPIVKLERLPVPSEVDNVVVINQNLYVPDLLSQNTPLSASSVQSVEDTSSQSSFYQDSSDGGILTDVPSPFNPPAVVPDELSDNNSCSSSDSIQIIEVVTKRDKRLNSKLCSLPSAKKCFTLPSKKKCFTLPSKKKCFTAPLKKKCVILPSRKKCLTLPSTKECFVVLTRIPA